MTALHPPRVLRSCSKDANADFTEQQTLKFYNDHEKPKSVFTRLTAKPANTLPAVFNLAADDIYSVDGKLLFAAGELVATSETGADGYTYFDCDIPYSRHYGSSIRKDATTNSGNYIVKELRALSRLLRQRPMEVTFTYDGQAVMVLAPVPKAYGNVGKREPTTRNCPVRPLLSRIRTAIP